MQLQLENGVNLEITETGTIGQGILFAIEGDSRKLFGGAFLVDSDRGVAEIFEKIFTGFGATGRTTNHADYVVEGIEGNLVAEQDMFALLGSTQLKNGAAADDIDAMFDEELDQRDQAQLARLAGYDGEK